MGVRRCKDRVIENQKYKKIYRHKIVRIIVVLVVVMTAFLLSYLSFEEGKILKNVLYVGIVFVGAGTCSCFTIIHLRKQTSLSIKARIAVVLGAILMIIEVGIPIIEICFAKKIMDIPLIVVSIVEAYIPFLYLTIRDSFEMKELFEACQSKTLVEKILQLASKTIGDIDENVYYNDKVNILCRVVKVFVFIAILIVVSLSLFLDSMEGIQMKFNLPSKYSILFILGAVITGILHFFVGHKTRKTLITCSITMGFLAVVIDVINIVVFHNVNTFIVHTVLYVFIVMCYAFYFYLTMLRNKVYGHAIDFEKIERIKNNMSKNHEYMQVEHFLLNTSSPGQTYYKATNVWGSKLENREFVRDIYDLFQMAQRVYQLLPYSERERIPEFTILINYQKDSNLEDIKNRVLLRIKDYIRLYCILQFMFLESLKFITFWNAEKMSFKIEKIMKKLEKNKLENLDKMKLIIQNYDGAVKNIELTEGIYHFAAKLHLDLTFISEKEVETKDESVMITKLFQK